MPLLNYQLLNFNTPLSAIYTTFLLRCHFLLREFKIETKYEYTPARTESHVRACLPVPNYCLRYVRYGRKYEKLPLLPHFL